MIKILIADDHQLLIDGIKSTLEDISDFSIVAEALNGSKVLEILESGISVDIILMDINMPEMDGLECTLQVTKNYPEIKIIGLSQYDEKRFIKRLLRNGAMGYLLKDTDKEILETAIREVFAGNKYFSDHINASRIEQELKNEKTNSLFLHLTAREKEVLSLVCQEYSSQEIADKLFISFHTVEGHRSSLLFKSGTKNTAGLVRWAAENNLISEQ